MFNKNSLAIIVAITISTSLSVFSQNVGINTTGSAGDASSMLDVNASDKGVLIPRVSLLDVSNSTLPINAPANGLLVYNTNAALVGGFGVGFYYWNGAWTKMATGNSLSATLTNGRVWIGNASNVPTEQLISGDAAVSNTGVLDLNNLAVETSEINDLAVTTVKIADNNVTTAKILDANVTTAKIADNNVTTAKILDANVTTSKIANNAVDGTKINITSNATGDLMYYNGTDWVRLPAGLTNNILQANGAAAPTWVDGSGLFIRNQNASDQTAANFRIDGTGRANNSFQSPLYTRADAGTVGIRPNTNSTTAIQLQNAAGTSILNVDATNSRVGIGVTPSEALHVGANIRADGIVFWGNGLSRTETRDNAGLQGNAGALSGFYETSVPAPTANWYPGANSWQHLIDVRHSNTANNFAMQIAGSFFDQNLWFRKTNNGANTAWSRILSTSDISGTANYITKFTGTNTIGNSQIFENGTNIGIGVTGAAVPLAVGGNGLDVYNTSVWTENNIHTQGNETLLQGGRGRLRVGTAWQYAGLYTEASSTGVVNDLVLGASSNLVRIGPNGGGQNLRVSGLEGTGNRQVYANANGVLNTSVPVYKVASSLHPSNDDITPWTNIRTACVDDGVATFTWGFNFIINGIAYSSGWISTNGVLGFGSATSTSFSNTALPSNISTDPMLFFHWDDDGSNLQRFNVLGTAPNRICYIHSRQSHQTTCSGGAAQVDVYITLHETSNLMSIRYVGIGSDADTQGAGATYGFQFAGGASAYTIPLGFNTKLLDDNAGNQNFSIDFGQ